MAPILKKKAYYSKAYLDFIREQPCCVTGKSPAEAAHVRDASNSGTAMKPHDTYALPLDHDAHICGEHGQGKDTFWGDRNQYKFCVIYLAKYFTEKKQKDFKRILLKLLISHLEKELDIDPFELILMLYREFVILNPTQRPKDPRKEALSLLFLYLDKSQNTDPYKLTIELVTDYLREHK